jgi:hypothetical protein
MNSRLKPCPIVALLFAAMWTPVRAQSVQYLPEIDAHLKLNSAFRAYLEAKDDQDGGESKHFEIGPSIQFYPKLPKLQEIAGFDLDDRNTRPLVLEAGYRYITRPNSPAENRIETVLTFRFELKSGFLISDRNRADLDWNNGEFSWRYRNKLALGRTIAVHSYQFIPYIAVEPYYESKYGKWSTTALYAGCLFPVGKQVRFNLYYEHKNETGKSPNQQENLIGVALNLYFSLDEN